MWETVDSICGLWITTANTRTDTHTHTHTCVCVCIIVVQWLSRVQLFATPWTTARKACLSFSVSWNLLKLKSIEVVITIQSSHPLSSPSPPALNLS